MIAGVTHWRMWGVLIYLSVSLTLSSFTPPSSSHCISRELIKSSQHEINLNRSRNETYSTNWIPHVKGFEVGRIGVCGGGGGVHTKFRGQHSQSVALDVKLFEVSQLSYLLRQWDQIVIPQTQLNKRKNRGKTRQSILTKKDLTLKRTISTARRLPIKTKHKTFAEYYVVRSMGNGYSHTGFCSDPEPFIDRFQTFGIQNCSNICPWLELDGKGTLHHDSSITKRGGKKRELQSLVSAKWGAFAWI